MDYVYADFNAIYVEIIVISRKASILNLTLFLYHLCIANSHENQDIFIELPI